MRNDSSNKWNDLVKKSVAEQPNPSRRADLESWWNKPVPMPEPPQPEKPGTLEYLDYGRNIPSLYADNTPVNIPSNSERVQSIWTCFVIAVILSSVTIAVITFVDALQ